MATTAEVIEFTSTDTSPLVSRMRELASAGAGWINVGPGLTPEEFASLPAPSAVAKWFSGRGPAVPMATWTPGSPSQIGLAHGTGPGAMNRLDEAGVELPRGWHQRQDHAKHGIVVELPASAALDAVVEWLLRAMVVLSPRVAIGDDWIAETYRR